MTIKRKDFQKAAALIHEFLLKLGYEAECAELRDALNLALLHMQRYYRLLRTRMQNIDKTSGSILAQSLRGLSPMTPFKDAPDKFQWRWLNLDNPKVANHLPADVSQDISKLAALVQTAKDGDNERIMQLIDDEPDCIFEADGLGRSALTYAVHFGHLDTIQILLENGIDVNAQAHDGSTAVHRACHDGNHEALQILISYGAAVSQADSQGRYPIHWACASRRRDCLALLIKQKVNVNVRDKEGMSPSMWACRMDHIEHFGLLTQAEQVVEEEDGYERDCQGRTWLHWSVRRTEPLECLRTLLTEDSATWRDEEGKCVMHTCAEQGSLEAGKVILDIAGTSVLDYRDNDNRSALILSAMGGHGEVLNYLLSQGADYAAVDDFGATAWEYARAKQLHYCMLIIASYIRQRAKEEEKTERDFDYVPRNDISDLALNGMGSLQINGDANTLYYGNKPIAPPHPPAEPPTPRTPRTTVTPRFNNSTPRAQEGWETPKPSSRSPPPTARGQTGVKRLPSGSDSNGDGNGQSHKPSKRESSANKRRKNDNRSPDRDSRMSIHSVNASQEFTDNRYNGEPEMNAESEYLNESESDHAEQEHSIAAMDVSDFEGGQEGDDERTIVDDALQPMEGESQAYARPFSPPRSTHVSTKRRSPPPPPHVQRRSPPPPGPQAPARPSRSPTRPARSPTRQAPAQKLHHSQPYYSHHNRDEHYDDDDDGEVVHTPSPPPRQHQPYSYQSTSPAPAANPPPHLQPLPPPSPGKRKKKKKKDSREPHLAPVAGPVPQSRGYAAPMQPPSSPHPSSASSHHQHPSSPHPSSASSHQQHPSSPRGREMSPTSRGSSAVSSNLSRHSGEQHGGGHYMGGGLVGSRPPSMKAAAKKHSYPDQDYRYSQNHLNQPSTGNKPPVFPKAAPRTQSQKLEPLVTHTHASQSTNRRSQFDNLSPSRNQVRGPMPQGPAQGQRLGSGQSQQRYAGLPNGSIQNGYADNNQLHNRYPQRSAGHSGVGSGGKKRSKPTDQTPASPRGKHTHVRAQQPPMSGKHMSNGRLPPTY